MASALASLFHGPAHALEQLRIAIEPGQHTLENQADVVEPRLQQSLRLDPLDLQLDFAQADVGADADLHEIAHFRHNRHLGTQIVDLDVDFVDLDDWDVEEDVRALRKLTRIDNRVVGELAPRPGST